MNIRCIARYENGVLKPKVPLALPEGAEVLVTVGVPPDPRIIAEAMAKIAALPMEGKDDGFSGQDHDAVLYPKEG